MHCSRRLIVHTLVFSRSYLHRQVSSPETLVVKGGSTWARNGRGILPENARLPRNIQGSFTCRKSTTWDKRLYLPSEGRSADDFLALKNPTASAGFEPANLGTKGQHATSRPLKPRHWRVTWYDQVCTVCHWTFRTLVILLVTNDESEQTDIDLKASKDMSTNSRGEKGHRYSQWSCLNPTS